MTEKKDTNVWYILGAVAIIMTILIIVFFMNVFKEKKEAKPLLTENDFKILSVAWQTYEDDYDKSTKEYFLNENKPIDWNKQCAFCEEYNNCESWYWEIITKVGKDKGCGGYIDSEERHLEVECELIIDGIKKLPHSNSDGSTSFLGFGDGIGISDEDIYGRLEGLDLTKDHTISFCCSNRCMEGNVCQTFTLPAKCHLN